MADTILKKWNSTTSQWEELNPQTTHTQIVASGTPDETTFLRGDGTWAVPEGVDNYVNTSGDTITGTLEFTTSDTPIKLQEDHFVYRKFDPTTEAVINSNTAYILLCRNAGGNDVNGTITMDRTSGLRHASTVDILISAGSSANPVGTMRSMATAGSAGVIYKLVTLTYSGNSFVALYIYNPDNYYDTSGMYFTGRIKTTDTANEFKMLYPADVSDVADFDTNASHLINGQTIWHAGNAADADDKVSKSGDTMTGNLTIDSVSFASLTLDRESTTGSSIVQFTNNGGVVGGVGGFGNDGLQFRTTDGTQMVIDASNNVGIGTTSPGGKLAVQQGSGVFTALLGADVTNGGLTNSTRKFSRIGMPHYTNAEEPVSIITGDSDGTNNILSIGGGTGSGNAATQIYLKTAANTTTVDGTTRLFIGSDGNVGIGTTSPNEKLTLPYGSYIGWEYSSTNSAVYHRIGKSTNGAGALEFKNSWTSGDAAIYSFFGNPGGTETELLTIRNDGDTDVNGSVKIAGDNRHLTFGTPGAGNTTGARFLSIEGNTDGNGEGSGRIFFTEHNSSTSSMDNYGMSIGYRGGDTSIVGASGNTWTGLSQIGNGQWGMWGHDASASGALIMYGDRAATFVNFANNNIAGVGSLTASSGNFSGNVLSNGNKLAWVRTQGTTNQSGVNFTLSGTTLYISTTA